MRLGQMGANCYLLIDEDKCLIIDPADEANFILEQIQRKKLKPLAMLATHGHFDHVMATGEIQLSFKIPLYICDKDLFLIKRLNKTAEHFLGYNPGVVEPTIIKSLKADTKFDDFNFQFIATPGHTPGSVSFYLPQNKVLFSGDTLFKAGIGRYDFSYSSKSDLDNSLKKLFKLPEDTLVYPGHGEETNIKDERFS